MPAAAAAAACLSPFGIRIVRHVAAPTLLTPTRWLLLTTRTQQNTGHSLQSPAHEREI